MQKLVQDPNWWMTAVFIALVVGILANLITHVSLKAFRSKVSLEPEAPLKSDSLIDTPFRVTNEGILPIYNIGQKWLLEQARGTEGVAIGMFEVEKIKPAVQANDKISKLSGSQSVTVYPFDNLTVSEVTVKRLKMMVIVAYETAVLHRRMSEDFFFEANEGADGKFHWYHSSNPPS